MAKWRSKQFKKDYPEASAAGEAKMNLRDLDLFKRGGFNKAAVNCCGRQGGPRLDWGRADKYAIEDGIKYLNRVAKTGRKCDVGLGPGNCVRISCSYNSAIYLCNDNNYGMEPNCDYIASYAQNLLNRCWFFDGIYGQEFDTEN
ncbi:hypothetical protein B0J14DRAFT_558889 [Halenospora varia]|nr:hypothetical protein B0J14DRAFT_558889 [Halenospora varia]